jgi:hypothetical protein
VIGFPVELEIHEESAVWLTEALGIALPYLFDYELDAIARRILDSLPREQIALSIALHVTAHLKARGIRDDAGDLTLEIASDAARSVVATLAGR